MGAFAGLLEALGRGINEADALGLGGHAEALRALRENVIDLATERIRQAALEAADDEIRGMQGQEG